MATAAAELVALVPALVDEAELLVVLVALVALPATRPELAELVELPEEVELRVWLMKVVFRGTATAEPEAPVVPTTPRVVVKAVGVIMVVFLAAMITVAVAVAPVDVSVVVNAEAALDAAPPTIANWPE